MRTEGIVQNKVSEKVRQIYSTRSRLYNKNNIYNKTN